MTVVRGYIIKVLKGEVIIGIPPSRRINFKTNDPYYPGDKVDVAWDLVNNQIASILKPGTIHVPQKHIPKTPTPIPPCVEIQTLCDEEIETYTIPLFTSQEGHYDD